METLLKNAQTCLQAFDEEGALFYAKNALALQKGEQTLHMLGTIYYRSHHFASVELLLEPYTTNWKSIALLYSSAVFKQSKYRKAQLVLECIKEPNDPVCAALLGKVYMKLSMRSQAVEQFEKSLALNPFDISSFKYLCDLGHNPSKKYFTQDVLSIPKSQKVLKSSKGIKENPFATPRHFSDPVKAITPVPRNARQDVSKILSVLAKMYVCYGKGKSDQIVQLLKTIPIAVGKNDWALKLTARTMLRCGLYGKAYEYFKLAFDGFKYDLDYAQEFSTTLWHLKKESEIAFLAQKMNEIDPKSASTLVVLGNCFSLQSEHDSAIKCFLGSLAIDPDNAYAHTLIGHEYKSNEEYEKAVKSYRKALSLDAQLYNAWFGLGDIFFRQNKFSIAVFSLSKAVELNASNSVLRCYRAIALSRLGMTQESKSELVEAIRLDPLNVLARYEFALALFDEGNLEDCKREIDILKSMTPKEAMLHYLEGQVQKSIGELEEASFCFERALSLDPRDQAMIQGAIIDLHETISDQLDEIAFDGELAF